MTGQFARTEAIGAARSGPHPSAGDAPDAGRPDVLHRLGPVGAGAPPGPHNGGGHGGRYLPETPEGGLGRSHSPYGITLQKAGTVPPHHRGRLIYQMTVKPQNCPLMKPAAHPSPNLVETEGAPTGSGS